MSGPLPAGYAMRPMLPDDVPELAQIVRASVEGLTGDDYDEEQQEAWLSSFADDDALAARLGKQLTLVATFKGEPVAFASLKGADEIDLLYVHPDHARRGVATLLVGALQKLATARGAARLTTDASDTARSFFEGLGYTAEQRNTVFRGGRWLSNTTMTLRLADPQRAAPDAGRDKPLGSRKNH